MLIAGLNYAKTAQEGGNAMKYSILLIIFLSTIFPCSLEAHEGMIAFFSDQSTSSCHVILPEFQVYRLPLYYIRGDGPRFRNACQFRVLKSSTGITLGMPEFDPSIHGLVITSGSLEGDYIMIGYFAGESRCAPDEDVFLLCHVPVVNISDPDSFTVSIVETISHHECLRGIRIIPCGTFDEYDVIGGTFVFNGDCYAPEDPFGNPTATENTSWGTIKLLLQE